MDIGLLQGIWTIVAMVVFLFVCVWAYSARRKPEFDAAARIPLEDDADENTRTRGTDHV